MRTAPRLELGTYVYAGVATTVLVGFGFIAAGAWRAGITLAGMALITAGVTRGALPERLAGLLRIRRRVSDVVLMLAFGVALITLATLIPAQR